MCWGKETAEPSNRVNLDGGSFSQTTMQAHTCEPSTQGTEAGELL